MFLNVTTLASKSRIHHDQSNSRQLNLMHTMYWTALHRTDQSNAATHVPWVCLFFYTFVNTTQGEVFWWLSRKSGCLDIVLQPSEKEEVIGFRRDSPPRLLRIQPRLFQMGETGLSPSHLRAPLNVSRLPTVGDALYSRQPILQLGHMSHSCFPESLTAQK